MSIRRILLSLAFVLASGAASAQIDLGRVLSGAKDLGTAATGISEDEEIKIGRDLAGRMLGAVQLMDDANVQAYVNRVGRWIASQSRVESCVRKPGCLSCPPMYMHCGSAVRTARATAGATARA